MRKVITILFILILLNSCSVQKCRYSNRFRIDLSGFNKAEKQNEIKAEKAFKVKNILVDEYNEYKKDTIFNKNTSININGISLPTENQKVFFPKKEFKNKDFIQSYIITETKKIAPQNTHGRIKTLRTLFTILGIAALILALVFVVLAITQLSYTFLLAATASSSLSFVLLYIGKRKLDLGIIELKKKWIKFLRDIAFVLMVLTLVVWTVLKIFYG